MEWIDGESESIKSGYRHFWRVPGGFAFYSYNGYCIKQRDGVYAGIDKRYGERYIANDIITVYLDLNKQQLSFSKNDKNQGIIPWKMSKNKKYHLAIALHAKEDELELISVQ